jgi:beta-glucanase (GH16 family)
MRWLCCYAEHFIHDHADRYLPIQRHVDTGMERRFQWHKWFIAGLHQMDNGNRRRRVGDNELETYTSRPQNAQLQDGNLVITAAQETFTGTDGITRNYTSARMKTAGLFTQTYGRFEARIKIPKGQGLWPAFWMLGNDISTTGWPGCGEIDIMENIGKEPNIVHGSMHGPGYSGGNPLTGSYTLPSGNFSDDFHVFAVEWEPKVARFYVDGNLYETHTPSDLPSGTTWVYDRPFFIILNVAVGGGWPGNPDQTTVFPQTMLVDYVRVYARKYENRTGS